MLTGTWTGWQEAQRAIGQLGEPFSRPVLLDALKRAGKPIAADMGARCPRDTGLTAEDFDVAESRDSKSGDEVTVLVGAHGGKGGRAFITRFIEYGFFNVRIQQHIPARPFMRPAWDSARGSYLDTMLKELRGAYQRGIKRFAKKAA